jgi:hypothetical protein
MSEIGREMSWLQGSYALEVTRWHGNFGLAL